MSKYKAMMIMNIIFTFENLVLGFGNKITHPSITNASVEFSGVDNYLKNQLGITDGLQIRLEYNIDFYQNYIEYRLQRGDYSAGGNNRTVLEWIKASSVIEDEDGSLVLPSVRPRHHFHDPTRDAGLMCRTAIILSCCNLQFELYFRPLRKKDIHIRERIL